MHLVQFQAYVQIYNCNLKCSPGVPNIQDAPVLMLRPRAWNMVEHNLIVCIRERERERERSERSEKSHVFIFFLKVNGKEVPGPLFDFGLLMFHNASILLKKESGPFFYLSKVSIDYSFY